MRPSIRASGAYDYASTMHYDPRAASAIGRVVFETVPPGMTIPSAGLSAGDVDGVARLYGKPSGRQPRFPPIRLALRLLLMACWITTPASFDWHGRNHPHS